jgi:hypothetical protein
MDVTPKAGKVRETIGHKSSRRALEWLDILRVIQDSKTLARVLSVYKTAGFKADDYKRLEKARLQMCLALTLAEDWLELERPKNPERVSIRDLRRKLEDELE